MITSLPNYDAYKLASKTDFRPGEEQQLADAEQRLHEQRHRVTHVIYVTCKDFDDSDFLQLAANALVQFIHPQMRDRELYEAFTVVDRAAQRDRQQRLEVR